MSMTVARKGETHEVTKTITEADVEAFADLSEDRNPLHLDPEYAERTRFKEPIVHGALTTSLISAALARFPGVVVFLDQRVKFHKPVYPGDTLTATASIYEYEGDNRFRTENVVVNQDGEVVAGGLATILIEDER